MNWEPDGPKRQHWPAESSGVEWRQQRVVAQLRGTRPLRRCGAQVTMLDFRRKQRQSRRPAQMPGRRIVYAIFGLGLVVILLKAAADPQGLPFFSQFSRTRTGGPAEVDTVVRPPVEVDEPGTFRAPAADVEPAAADREYFSGVRAEFLRRVKDDEVFRGSEHDAFFHLFSILDRTPESELAAASVGRIGYAQLFGQSSVYRGEVVSLHGAVRRVKPLDAPNNEYGIERYYQLVMEPDDSPTNPIIVYALKFPDGMPISDAEVDRQRPEVTIHGFYYKRWAYPSQDRDGAIVLRKAPLILAGSFGWVRPPARQGPAPLSTLVAVLAGTLVIAGLVSLWLFRQRGVLPQGFTMPQKQPQDLRVSDTELAPSPGQWLSQLAEASNVAPATAAAGRAADGPPETTS
jgi:hypothetical protein